jgi:hypothetical protein
MTIHIELRGSYRAAHPISGLSIDTSKGRGKYKSPLGPLCRKLRDAGYEPDERVHVTRDGIAVFKRDLRLSDWADWDILDTQTGIQRFKYRPFPERISKSSGSRASGACEDQEWLEAA